jgi:serine/threonine-protein kinase
MADAADRLNAALSDRYAILRELGQGGMATVYLAQDLKHRRQVAVKVLRPELAATIGAERFLREVDIAANLQHPHILALYDSGEADGFLYYVMPYVEGHTLRQRLVRERELPVPEAVCILRDVADALTEAHAHGVVHRDLKPENIMLSGHHALVADFGVAKAVSEATGRQALTTKGVALGTPTYMPPEQAAADPLTDHRADIYALGVVAYEMLTGDPPFVRTTAQAMMAAHLTEAPVAVKERRGTIPPALAALIMRCLEKKPADRPQRTEELLVVLEGLATPSGGMTHAESQPIGIRWGRQRLGFKALSVALPLVIVGGVLFMLRSGDDASSPAATEVFPTAEDGRPSIAVLPLDNFSPNADDAYFADGVHEEIISKLSKISALRVISRNSVMGYREERRLTRQVASELGVAFILEGSARIGGGMVRVTLQLIDGTTDEHLWSVDFDRPYSVGDFIAIQSEVAQQVASHVRAEISSEERARIEEAPTAVGTAYVYYLRGNYFFNRSLRAEDMRAALDMYERAIESDSTFALAFAKRSIIKSRLHFYDFEGGQSLLPGAERDLERATSLAPELPDVHLARGYFYYWGRSEYLEAMEAFATVTQLDPSNVEAWAAIGFVQRRQGQLEDALLSLGRAAALDPRTARWRHHLGITATWLRQYATAVEYYDMAIALSPEVSDWYEGNSEGKAESLLLWDGNTTRARAVIKEAEVATDLRDKPFNHFAFVLDVLDGEYQGALTRLDSVRTEVAVYQQQVFAPTDLLRGHVYQLMGQTEKARDCFESARDVVLGLLEEDPNDYRLHSSLALAYAGLGEKARAVEEGQRGVELLPYSADAFAGVFPLSDLARVYVLVGDFDAAINGLEFLLSVPSNLSVPLLRLDPIWDPLHDNPRFQALLVKYADPKPAR